MLQKDYTELLYEVNYLSEFTDEIIRLIYRLIDIISAIFDDSEQIRSDIDTYNSAIHILENVLKSNEKLRKTVEAYMQCSSALASEIDFGFQPQSIRQDKSKLEEKDETARRIADRRKALADALRKGEPVAISPEGETANLSTADAIAALRSQLAGGEAMVNADGTVFNPYDSSVQESCGDGFKSVDKAVVAGGNISDWNSIQVPDGKMAGGYGMCRICGEVFNQSSKFCPECGTRVVIEKPVVQLSKVEFSAVAPKQLIKGEYSIVDIVMYEESFKHIVDEIRRQSDSETQEKKSGKIKVPEEANIKVILSSNDIEVEDNEMTGVWQGSYLSFSFPIYLPENYRKKQVLFVAKIFINNIIATNLTFVARCSSLLEQKINVSREDVLTAFISYASQDRKKVATIVQGMQKARPDMDVFFDVESLRSGEDWEKTLFHEIEKRDVLYLCWSHNAKESEWVDREWRYAYSQKGIDGIEPMPIELPEECPPPQELSGKHWNDKLLYLIGHLNKKSSEKQPQSTTPEWDDSWS